MKRHVLTTVALSAALVSGVACAQQAGFYGGASFARADLKVDGFKTVSPTALSLTLGNQIDKYIAGEFRYGFSLSDDTLQVNGVDVKAKIKDYMGVYVKGFVPVTLSGSLYGIAGYTSGKVSFSGPVATTSESDSGVSFGVGGSFAINRLTFVTIEWMRLLKGDDYTLNTLGAGVNFRF
ncbi:MAG: hypothetical protein RLY71_2754 [Pseudomonadota bacterium]|jgi:hypothetical protein